MSTCIKQFLAVTMVVALAATFSLIPGFIAPPTPAAAATPATPPADKGWNTNGSTWQFGDCSIRNRGGNAPEVTKYGDELCWIDMKEATSLSGPKTVTKDLGRYTMTYTLDVVFRDRTINAVDTTHFEAGPLPYVPNWKRIAVGTNARNATSATVGNDAFGLDDRSVFGNTVNGVNYFLPESGDPNQPVVKVDHGDPSRNTSEFTLRNIKVTDKFTGQAVADPRFVVADAQQTTFGAGSEVFQVDGRTSTTAQYTRLTPQTADYKAACADDRRWAADNNDIFGPTTTEKRYNHFMFPAGDFMCYEYSGLVRGTVNAGTFMVSLNNPSDLSIRLGSWSSQGFALALDMGRMRGNVTADTDQEKLATGQTTDFDFKMGVRNADGTTTPAPWQGSDLYTQVMRSGTGSTSTDKQMFSSTASGTQSDRVFDRYDPVWTCTTPRGGTQTIRQGSVPAGYRLTDDPATKTSTLLVDNSENEPITCNVQWTPKFVAASLALSKAVSGTASRYAEVTDRTFDLSYTCVPPHDDSKTDQQAIDEFKAAYPLVPLTGTRRVQSGEQAKVEGLPAGSTCSVSEARSASPRADSGMDHDLTWQGASEDPNNTDTFAPVTLTLKPADDNTPLNRVDATNTYTAHTGTLTLTKTVTGDPVDVTFGTSKTYQFDVNCPTSGFRKTVALTLTGTDGSNSLTGTTSVTGVPTGRDCTVTPLTGLSPEEQQTVKFDDRTVTFDGQPTTPDGFGAYPFKLPDYPAGGTPTTSAIDIRAAYSWKTRSVKVSKQISGPGASMAKKEHASYPMRYSCSLPNDPSYSKAGVIDVASGDTASAAIDDVRVGAQCTIFEDTAAIRDREAAGSSSVLDKTTVTGSDANDQAVTLDNEEAKTRPVITVIDSNDANQNKVVVTNHFGNRLSTVNLTKLVDHGGLGVSLPTQYSLQFDCGVRTLETANGLEAVPLRGTATVTADSSNGWKGATLLVADDARANTGPGGTMEVPYGNVCTLSEDRPDITSSGVLWSAKLPDVTIGESETNAEDGQVNDTTTDIEAVNLFRPTGDGLTIRRQIAANPQMSGPLNYTLTCTNGGERLPLTSAELTAADGSVSTIDITNGFTLDANEELRLPASAVPEGATCDLDARPYTDAMKTRTVGDVSFPVAWKYRVTYPSDADGTQSSNTGSSDGDPLSADIVVGSKSVVTITNDYDYTYGDATASKTVEFPGDPNSYISDARKEVKRSREFTVNLTCTAPYGGERTFTATVIAGSQTVDAKTLQANDIPIGSICTATEEASTSAVGIDLVQTVSVDGAPRDANGTSFEFNGNHSVEFINAYTRRLASVELNKIANTPIDLSAYRDQFHNHTFTMTCVDSQADGRPVLGTFTGTIQGPGQYTFEDVPVGAECSITGDQFGRLDLTETDDDGKKLETHLRPTSVDWTVARNDGTTEHDTTLTDETTTSMGFIVEEDAPDGEGNIVNLTNNYDWVTAPLTFSKTVTAHASEWDRLDATRPSFDFDYHCEGVGYSAGSTAGEQSMWETIPDTVTWDMLGDETTNPDGTVSRTYKTDKIHVPSGSLCTGTESEARDVPPVMTMSTSLNGEESSALTQRVEEGTVQPWDFTNTFSRMMVPVRLVAVKGGDAVSAIDPAATFVYNVSCDDGAQTTARVVSTLDGASADASVTGAMPPSGGEIIYLPADANCTVDGDVEGDGSSALAPNSAFEVTQGDRRPFMQFGQWNGATAVSTNPTVAGEDLKAADVTADMKDYQHTFKVPTGLAPSSTGEAVTIAGEATYMLDRVPVTFTKNVEGAPPEAGSFTFNATCTAGDTSVAQQFTVDAGETFTMGDVPVTGTCQFNETAQAEPLLDVQSHGKGWENVASTNVFGTPDEPGQHYVRGDVLPVADASTNSSDPSLWSLTAVNRYPSMKVDKVIDGTPISSVTGAVADTALLPHTADRMHFRYTIENTGAVAMSNIALTEPGLAGRTVVAADGSHVTIGADGAIPKTVCETSGSDLAVGGSSGCEFDVLITEPTTENFAYPAASDGVLTVTATTPSGTLTESDQYGALRPKESVAWLLPETGVQTLLWVLLIGLIILGIGLWKHLRETRS